MKKKNLLILLAGIVIGLGLFLYGAAVGRYRIPPYALLFQAENYIQAQLLPTPHQTPTPIPPTPVPAAPEKIQTLITSQNFKTQTEKIDFIREFVNHNSKHDDPGDYAYDTPRVLEMMFARSEGRGDPPALLCDSRSLAMMSILEGQNISYRYVHVFSDDYETLQSHTFLEVFNEDSQQWEIQDSDYDITWIHSETKKRVSLAEMIFGNLDKMEPVSNDPKNVSKARKTLQAKFFKAAVYRNEQGVSLGLINTDRLSSEKLKTIFKTSAKGQDGYALFVAEIQRRFQPVTFLFNQNFSGR